MHTVKELEFMGHHYKVSHTDVVNTDASWFTFDDEASVRNEFWHIESGAYVLDIGAAYGSYSLTALACGADHVWAWSPERGHAGILEADLFKESLELNGWADRCTVYQSGLYSKSGSINTVTQEFSTKRVEADGSNVINVDVLDESFECTDDFYGKSWWMKLDVEGAEVEVLNGARLFIRAYRPKLLIENHNFKRATLEQEVRDLVTSWGYKEVGTRPYHSVSHSFYLPPGASQ